MKLHAILLPVLLAAPASAQVAILPGGYNPHIGAPVTLPSPAVNYPAITRIELPAPRLDPALNLTLSPVPSVAIMAVIPVLPIPMIPSRPVVPVIRPVATRENVSHPLAPILPGLNAQFSDEKNAEKKGKNEKTGRRDALDELFDGRSQPVRPGRTVYLPERELEIEIGAY